MEGDKDCIECVCDACGINICDDREVVVFYLRNVVDVNNINDFYELRIVFIDVM